MKKRGFLWGLSALLLTLALIFTACDTSATEVEGTVGISNQDTPEVTEPVELVPGGVLLEWKPILDATDYTVWRKESGEDAPEAIRLGTPSQDTKTGKYRYVDLVSDDNVLKPNIEYTYTVIAEGTTKTAAKKEVKVTTGAIPAKGTMQLTPVSDVTLVLDQEAEKIIVSWKEPKASLGYNITVYRDTSQVGGPNVSFGTTSASIDWSVSNQTSGKYVAQVVAKDNRSIPYFKDSNIAASTGQQFEALFGGGSGSSPSASRSSAIVNNSNTITGFSAAISFGSVKPEVVYTVERADVDAAGNAGTYGKRDVYSDPSATTILNDVDLTGRALGMPTVYDKGLEFGKTYKYRIKATKGTGATAKTQTREISGFVTGEPRDFAYSSISIGAPTGTNPKTYNVSPTLFYKGALQTGDKLVIYYVKGNSSYGYELYRYGTYTKGIEFTKAELEAAASKDLDIPQETGDNVAYVQAYLEFSDGREPQNVSYSSYGGSGVTSNSSSSYWNGNEQIYYGELNDY
jgi:hypothetical protein